MKTHPHKRLSSKRHSRFELLEPRHVLSSTNIAITADNDVQHMPSVAVNPFDPQHVVVAYMDYSLLDVADDPTTPDIDEHHDHLYAGIGVATSYDGGATWSYSLVPLPAGFDPRAATGMAAPTIKFDAVDHDLSQSGVQNRAYVVFMAAQFMGEIPAIVDGDRGAERAMGMQSLNGIFVSHSNDGGLTWQAPVAVSNSIDAQTGTQTSGPNRYDGSHDVPFDIKPDLAVDTFATLPDGSANPRFGQLYATWVRFYPAGEFPGEEGISDGGSQIMIAVSSDSNQSWVTQLEQRSDTPTFETVLEDPLDTGITGLPPGRGVVYGTRATVGPEGDVYVSVQWLNGFIVFHSLDATGEVLRFDRPDPPVPNSREGWPFGVVPIAPTPAGVPGLDFRLDVTRAIAADPTRPGSVYVADAADFLPAGDHGDIAFAKSSDYGDTWDPATQDRDDLFWLLNDDNGRKRAGNGPDDIVASQMMPWLVAGANGLVALIWYDTRRDTQGHRLDVFATVSTDFGETFSPNFRVTTESFDATLGVFENGRGEGGYAYFGDAIGMALANRTMYAAWTDTREGNQDIYFSRISLESIPAPPNDRFEDNDTRAMATAIGPDPVFVSKLRKLHLAAGEADWFRVSPTIDQLSVVVEGIDPSKFVLEVFDANGNAIALGSEISSNGSSNGRQILSVEVSAGHDYFVRVLSNEDVNGAGSPYSLTLSTVKEDLGELVYRKVEAEFPSSGQIYYLMQAKVTGSIEASFVVTGAQQDLVLEFIDPSDPTRIVARATGNSPTVNFQVRAGQHLLVRVAGEEPLEASYRLELENVDQYNSNATGINSLYFAAGEKPAAVAVADFNHDGVPDMVVSNTNSNTVSVFTGNGDGTFQSPRQLTVGAFAFTQQFFRQTGRYVLAADVNGDTLSDIIVNNYDSSDISVLLGRGDGTFEPQRRYNATGAPFSIDLADVNGDNALDLVVVDSTVNSRAQVGVLLNRPEKFGQEDWSFQQPILFASPIAIDFFNTRVKIADVDQDGRNDLLIGGLFDHTTHLLLGNGDGTFTRRADLDYRAFGADLQVVDLNGDGFPDVVQTQYANLNKVSYSLNRGDGSGAFHPPQEFISGASPISSAVVDFNGDGVLDLIVANSGEVQPLLTAAGGVMLHPGLVDDAGQFAGFGPGITLSSARFPHDLQVADFNRDGAADVAVVDGSGIEVIFGEPPVIRSNSTRATARDLGAVVHLVQPTLTITPTHNHAWFRLRAPVDSFPSSGRQVLDFSAGFTNQSGAGLSMEIVDAAGTVLASGDRLRLAVDQGQEIFVHVFGVPGSGEQTGTGAYSLVINALPQVATIEPHSLLPGVGMQPGGPTTSLVVVFQGDFLDTATATNAQNYSVRWLGPDGIKSGDDQMVPIAQVVYTSSGNADVSSARDGVTFAKAHRQTATLLFDNALAPGNYEVTVSPAVISTAFDSTEASLLSPGDGFTDHSLVSNSNGTITNGASVLTTVRSAGSEIDLAAFAQGTRPLTQLYSDLQSLLDSQLTAQGADLIADDVESVTKLLFDHIVARIAPALGQAGQPLIDLLLIFTDPVSQNVVAPTGDALRFDLNSGSLQNSLRNAFVEVAGNIELVVILNPVGTYQLDVADVPPSARGGWAYFGSQSTKLELITRAMREGVRSFEINLPSRPVEAPNRLPGFPLNVPQQPLLSPASTIFNNPLSTFVRSQTLALNVLFAGSGALLENLLSSTTDDGSDSADSPSPLDLAWESFSDLWDDLDALLFTDENNSDRSTKENEPATSPIRRFWDAMTTVWNGVLEPWMPPQPEAASTGDDGASRSDGRAFKAEPRPNKQTNADAPPGVRQQRMTETESDARSMIDDAKPKSKDNRVSDANNAIRGASPNVNAA